MKQSWFRPAWMTGWVVLVLWSGGVRPLVLLAQVPRLDIALDPPDSVLLSWPAGRDLGYRLEWKDSVLGPAWYSLPGRLVITEGTRAEARVPIASTRRFYRVAQVGSTVSGWVVDAAGPVSGATVRIQGTTNQTLSDAQGHFVLGALRAGETVSVSAWKHQYYCAKAGPFVAPDRDLRLTLRRYQTTDNPSYRWVPPIGGNSCMSCKPDLTRIWIENDAHAGSARNSRFLTMYNGTDVQGRRSPLTRYAFSPDYGRVPLPPDPLKPYYGPGYTLDFPTSAGDCAACHTPGAALDAPYSTNPNAVTGADQFGVHCDFCHKVADVILNPSTSRPFNNRPGVLSMDVRRPFPDDPERYQLFFGTFDDDNVPQEDTNLPLLRESRFCAPCHFGVFWNVVIYNSFGEWLASPYSDPQFGKTCQACHMPAPSVLDGKVLTNVAPGQGGIERDPLTIHAHTFPGAMSQELLQNALSMHVTAQRVENQVQIEVRITNDRTGHHVPTDSPLRHLILLVAVTDPIGQPLRQVAGPTVPEWGGRGNPAEGNYAGLPGKAFAKVLEELWTEVSPTAAYWNPTRLVSDNRLAAYATDASRYTFLAPAEGDAVVKVTLWFRRAFKPLMDQKGWEAPDILMAQEQIRLP